MKRVVVGAFATAMLLVGAAPASPATPTQRQVAALQKQVKTLQRQVRTLQTQVRDARAGALAGQYLGFCIAAVTADALQSTWAVVNQVAGRAVVAPSPAVNDRGLCSQVFRVQRQSGVVPPTISPFNSLFALLTPSRAFAFPSG